MFNRSKMYPNIELFEIVVYFNTKRRLIITWNGFLAVFSLTWFRILELVWWPPCKTQWSQHFPFVYNWTSCFETEIPLILHMHLNSYLTWFSLVSLQLHFFNIYCNLIYVHNPFDIFNKYATYLFEV